MRYRFGWIGLGLLVSACVTEPTQPQHSGETRTPASSQEIAPGQSLAADRCGRCHAIDKNTEASPHASAPPFAEIVQYYPPEALSEAFSEGIMVGHEDMPEFQFSDEEVRQLIYYLKSLE
jgi:mono/diheme cytochrome c family protein